MTIEENKPLNETIVTVLATDIDTVGEQTLEYGIRRGDPNNFLIMGRYNGKMVRN